jgi:hypothetical protein
MPDAAHLVALCGFRAALPRLERELRSRCQCGRVSKAIIMDFAWHEALLWGVNTLLYYGKLLCIRAATIYRDCRYIRRMHMNNTQITNRLFLHNLVCILHSIFYTKSTEATEMLDANSDQARRFFYKA